MQLIYSLFMLLAKRKRIYEHCTNKNYGFYWVSQETTDLVTCTKEILNGKLHFLYSGTNICVDRFLFCKPLKYFLHICLIMSTPNVFHLFLLVAELPFLLALPLPHGLQNNNTYCECIHFLKFLSFLCQSPNHLLMNSSLLAL